MGDKAFDRVPIGFLEKPISDDFNRMQSQADRALREVLMNLLGGRISDSSDGLSPQNSCMNSGFAVVPVNPPSMNVQVNTGLAWQYLTSGTATDIGVPDLIGVDDLSPFRPLLLTVPQLFAVPAAPGSPNSRIDMIEVRAERSLIDSLTRRQLNATTGAFDPHNYYKTLTHLLDGLTGAVSAPAASTAPISYVTGVAGNPGVAPTVSPGYFKLAEILVNNGTTSITTAEIIDKRKLAAANGMIHGFFRVRVNSTVSPGAAPPVLTVRSTCFPAGVKFACATNSHAPNQRGTVTIYVVAGEPTEATCSMQVSTLAGAPGPTELILPLTSPQTVSGEYLVTADSTVKAALAAATPPITVAIGQKVMQVTFESRYAITGGTVNSTNAALEDIEVQGNISLGYH